MLKTNTEIQSNFMWSNIILTPAQVHSFNKSVGESCEGNKMYHCLCCINPKVKKHTTHALLMFLWFAWSGQVTVTHYLFRCLIDLGGSWNDLGMISQVQLLNSEFYLITVCEISTSLQNSPMGCKWSKRQNHNDKTVR